jgi:EmrB/QacA subfamily drug resistance transporter
MDAERRKSLTLVACVLSSAVALLDGTVVNVALPAMEQDLGGGLATQQWVVNSYTLALGSFILIGGSLGDVYGERRIFALGVVLFAVTSALCAAAPTSELLIAARALQGVAGALLTPAALAVIIATFDRDERGRAIGTWTAWTGIGALAGPLIGGQILELASWRWIFLVTLPALVVTLLLIRVAIPPSADTPRERHVDVLGAALAALGLGGPVFALIAQPEAGWTAPEVAIPGLVGLALLAAFFVHERRSPDPMLPLGLFGRRNFAWGNVETLGMYAGLGIQLFLVVLFLQEVAGWSPLAAGTATVPITIVMFLTARRFGALADTFGPRFFMGAGPLVAGVGTLLFLRLGRDVAFVTDVLPAITVFSIGLSMTVAPLTAAVLAETAQAQAGIASAVNNAVARVAGLLGVAVIGTVAGGTLTLEGFHRGVALAAGLLIAAGLAGALGIRNPRRTTVRAEAHPAGQLGPANADAAGCPEARAPAETERVAA